MGRLEDSLAGVPYKISSSFGQVSAAEQNFWMSSPQAGLGAGSGYAEVQVVQPVVEGQQIPVWPVFGPIVEAFSEPLYQAGVGLVDAIKDVAADPFKPLREGPFGIWGNDSSTSFGVGGSSGGSFGGNEMAIGGSRVRYGPWGPVPAVSRLETIAKFGRELTDSEFAAHFGYYPGSGRRRFRRRYGGMRYGTGFRGRRTTGRTRRYY